MALTPRGRKDRAARIRKLQAEAARAGEKREQAAVRAGLETAHVEYSATVRQHLEGAIRDAPVTSLRRWRLRLGLRVAAMLLTLEAAVFLAWVFTGPSSSEAFAVTWMAKDVMFAVLCWIAATDNRRFGSLARIVVWGQLGLFVLLALTWLVGSAESSFPSLDAVDENAATAVWLGLTSVVAAALARLRGSARRAELGLRRLRPFEYDLCLALAGAVLQRPLISPAEIARNVDRYLARIPDSKARAALVWFAFYPVFTFKPPGNLMAPAARRAYLTAELASLESGRHWLGATARAAMRLAVNVVYIGYYGDAGSYTALGVEPPALRPAEPRPGIPLEEPRTVPLEELGDEPAADVVVVGSGPAGASAAARLAEGGREVLLLERGEHVRRDELSGSESELWPRIVADGGLSFAGPNTRVVRGRALGGGGLRGDGVWMEPPPRLLETGGLATPLQECFAEARGLLATRLQPDAPSHGVLAGLGAEAGEPKQTTVSAGAAPGTDTTLSVAHSMLPELQRRHGSDRVRIVTGAQVRRVQVSSGRAEALDCTSPSGRRVRITAQTVIIAAGALGSAILLRQSRLGGPGVGGRISMNVECELVADFPELPTGQAERTEAVLLERPDREALVFESGRRPPMAQALSMPSSFAAHEYNMQRYRHLLPIRVIAGTGPVARILPDIGLGRQLDFRLPFPDFERLLDGVVIAARHLFDLGAARVLVPTLRYLELRSPEDVKRLGSLIRGPRDLYLTSPYLHGGCVMGPDPEQSVVDPDFRLRGTENVYVCDTSLLAASVVVPTQATAIALGLLAGGRIATSA